MQHWIVYIATCWMLVASVCSARPDTWEGAAPMRVAVDGLSASVVGPTLYVVGGVDGLLQAYDSVRDRWTLKASMPTARRDLATGVVDGLIYAVGGRVDPWGFTDVVEVYDPRTDTWQKRAPLPQGRGFLGAATVAGKLYAVGGYNGAEIFSSLDSTPWTRGLWDRVAARPWLVVPLHMRPCHGQLPLGAHREDAVPTDVGSRGICLMDVVEIRMPPSPGVVVNDD